MSGGLTRSEFDALQAVKAATDSPNAKHSPSFDAQKGWLTVTEIREFSGIELSKNVRPTLIHLERSGYLSQKAPASIRHFRLNEKGLHLLKSGFSDENDPIVVDSASWTGIIEPVQIQRVLLILSDMEDVCESIRNNRDRAQIFGLIRALEVLLTVPDPPRQGVVSLLRDPAFANVVQVGTFLAALIAAVKP